MSSIDYGQGNLRLSSVMLGGATTFSSMHNDMIFAASMILTRCHEHNFAVCIHGGRRGILMSPLAYRCLRDAGLYDNVTIKETQWNQ